jgi:4-hydroxy-3-polyprenylbenzoate decarboxylase
MIYKSLEQCVNHLEANKQLVRITDQVDPNLEMAAIHLRVHAQGGPALLFENVKGCRYRALSNLFGTTARSRFIFQDRFKDVQTLISLRKNPTQLLKNPLKALALATRALAALPKGNTGSINEFEEVQICDLPLIKHWPNDGGAFVTLPQVYSEDANKPGIYGSNLGMYRIQLTGNQYITNREIGLHYQLHRGIGVHQTIANEKMKDFYVSIFVGGPPAHTLASVMPLPEGMPEVMFGGFLTGRRFRYRYIDGYCISQDADFIITGKVEKNQVKPEGPFGDHLGYYSLTHDFPVMKVHKVYARKNGIWPFTVVGRPPQEDTSFGHLIHELTGNAVEQEIPGLKEVHAVDAAGVHPLLLAVGSERYTPYGTVRQSAELLTIANHILGTGQLSLAKFLWITAPFENSVSSADERKFLTYMLERIHWNRDIHFYTNTSIDTLDYSGEALNQGSKVVFAAFGPAVRSLCSSVPSAFEDRLIKRAVLAMPGVVCIELGSFTNYAEAQNLFESLNECLEIEIDGLKDCPLIIACDDAVFTSASIKNFLWVTFTRTNPSHDIYGIRSFQQYKHWGCDGPLVFDARMKPHHAPVLEIDQEVERHINKYFTNNGPLKGY